MWLLFAVRRIGPHPLRLEDPTTRQQNQGVEDQALLFVSWSTAMPPATDFHLSNFGQPENSKTLERFVQLLLNGDRVSCRDLLREFLQASRRGGDRSVRDATDALRELIWPACAALDHFIRHDQITAASEHCATVLLAQLAQRIECALPKQPARCRTVIVTSGATASEELAGEIFAGIAEADGYEVVFLGGGVESDDLFAEIGQRKPAFVVSFAASGPDAPKLRRLLTALRTQVPVVGLRVGVGGGVFARASGLADEIGADFEADTPFDMLEALQGVDRAPASRAQNGSHKEGQGRSRAA